ncbi:hypothetical protein FQR65_LT14229 [Abscondita terminalis]|nr:hypothetical protein FQR65_LT14229 [Abscondita terminalis]
MTQSDTSVVIDEDWYVDGKIKNLAKNATKRVENDAKIALISCPTLYKKLKETQHVKLFEYDKRFLKVCGDDFIYYGYKVLLDMPRQLANQFDLVIAYRPFLSDECLTKTAVLDFNSLELALNNHVFIRNLCREYDEQETKLAYPNILPTLQLSDYNN